MYAIRSYYDSGNHHTGLLMNKYAARTDFGFTLTIELDGVSEVLEKDDLLIEINQTEGFVSDSDRGVTVVLDTTLTPELIEEGFVREIISKLQTMRKEADFEVMDKITVYQTGNETIEAIMKKNEVMIKSVVLATSFVYGSTDGYTKEWNLNGEDVVLAVKKN